MPEIDSQLRFRMPGRGSWWSRAGRSRPTKTVCWTGEDAGRSTC